MKHLEDALVCYAANAISGRGGQGEFLRHMVYSLDQLPHARVVSRSAKGCRSECLDIQRSGWRKTAFSALQRAPFLRRRRDLLTLIDDVDFDSGLSQSVQGVQLLDGVMGQCSKTFEALSSERVPLILTALNMHVDELASMLADENRRLGIRTPSFVHPGMRKRVLREIERATRIRVISAAAKQSFVERGTEPERVEILLPAVDLDHFHPVAQKDDVFRVLAVATIDPRKGIYYLLQAFEKADIPNSELVIIGATGDPWSRQMLKHFMTKMNNIRVQSADVVKDPIVGTYGQASLFVHPAIEDGFALAVGQALACGKAVITTRQTGASQLIKDGQNGYVLECRDVDGLVDYLRLLARERSLLGRLSAAAPDAVAHLGYPSVAAQVAAFYSQVLAEA
jgi:hypothetical protein